MKPRTQTLRDLMIRAGEKARTLPPPEKFLWCAVWWHLDSRESANPAEAIGFARNQLRLAKDIAARPQHYAIKPNDRTHYQWSKVGDDKATYEPE